MVAVPPSQVGVIVNEASSIAGMVTDTEVVVGQAPVVVYSTVYVAPVGPFVISHVLGLITAPSVGIGLKTYVPPVSTVIIAVAPVQLGIKVKDVSSSPVIVSVWAIDVPQIPEVVYFP